MAPGQPDSGTIYRELTIADLETPKVPCYRAVIAATAPTSVPEKSELSFTVLAVLSRPVLAGSWNRRIDIAACDS
jgi:hypothetical protein